MIILGFVDSRDIWSWLAQCWGERKALESMDKETFKRSGVQTQMIFTLGTESEYRLLTIWSSVIFECYLTSSGNLCISQESEIGKFPLIIQWMQGFKVDAIFHFGK